MDNNYFGNICYCRKCNGIVHTIKKGDTLYLLSRYYNVPIGEIMNANRNLNVYNLRIGEEICIPMRRSDMLNNNVNETMPEAMPRRTTETIEGSPENTETMEDHLPASSSTHYDDIEYTSMDISPDTKSAQSLDENMLMSELISQKDMTLGKFLSLIQN